MKEQLYTIPVNDAFNKDCECPVCEMYKQLENDALEFVMGPSYMEDDIRMETDKVGFCPKHISSMYLVKNRLGLALMMNTHNDRVIRDLKELSKSTPAPKKLFGGKKGSEKSPVAEYIDNLENSCYVCNRIKNTFVRYIDTIFHLWKKDKEFVSKFKSCKGFCTCHYGLLYEAGREKLGGGYGEFVDALNEVYFTNMERVNEDISWFIDKFDYRNENEPWKNSKDAIPRGIIKQDHTFVE